MRLAALALIVGLPATPIFADDFLYFHSPSGNIHCVIITGEYAGVRCDMLELSRSFAVRPADCDLEWGSSFEVGARDPQGYPACVGDTVINPDSPELGYGGRITQGGFTCASEKTGVTCTNAKGHGFSLSKARQKLF